MRDIFARRRPKKKKKKRKEKKNKSLIRSKERALYLNVSRQCTRY